MKQFTLVALLVTVGLAGCLSDGGASDDGSEVRLGSDYLNIAEIPLSETRFSIMDAQPVWIESTYDGTMLYARLWRPDVNTGENPDPNWKAPVILVDSPYETSDTREDMFDSTEMMGIESYDWLITELVPRGYAVAYKDVRGTSESGGCLQQTGHAQSQDGYDAIEYFGTQPWSNDHVGMYGKSYLAETQYSAAILQPPHLTTIVPVASVSGQYEWNLYDGVPFTLATFNGNRGYYTGSGTPPGTTEQGIQNYLEHHDCQTEMFAAGADISGDWNDYWEERELRKHFHKIQASVLYVHGLQDWNVRQVAIRDSFEHIPSEKRLMLGQWHHDHPHINTMNDEWSRADWLHMVHAWYDHELLGLDNGIMAALPPVQIQDSQGAWRAEASYPPADAGAFSFHLSPDTLQLEQPADWSVDLRENEEAFLREQVIGVIPDADTPQATELVFTSEPLASDLRFSGWPTLEFDAMLFDGLYPDPDTEIDAHFAAHLEIIDCDDAEWINVGYLSARHRNGVENPEVVPEDEVITYTLQFHPADTVVPAGCRLELRFAGSDEDSQPEGTFWGGTISRGVLQFPTVERDLSQVGLNVPFIVA